MINSILIAFATAAVLPPTQFVPLPPAAQRPPPPTITLYINEKPVKLTPGMNIFDPTEDALVGGKGFPADYDVIVDLHTTYDDQTRFCAHPIHELGAFNSKSPTMPITKNTKVGCVGVIVKKK